MLVLSRKINEQIVIGDDIILTVVSIRGAGVRIGIDAPANVSVHRGEVSAATKQAPPAALPSAANPNQDGTAT
ncbi:MAG: carbon storage regulator CsrA [Thermogutta sp.]|nr:carbon storage regulator CsrA [Thermogutta sp.]